MISLTRSPIDVAKVTEAVTDRSAGAIVLLVGTTREYTRDRQTLYLNYECHEPLVRSELERLLAIAKQQWPASRWCIVHRLGRIDLGEASVAIAVSMPHRQEAFSAAQWMIDRLKESVPIWKQEHAPDGTSEWIHPVPPSVGESTTRDATTLVRHEEDS